MGTSPGCNEATLARTRGLCVLQHLCCHCIVNNIARTFNTNNGVNNKMVCGLDKVIPNINNHVMQEWYSQCKYNHHVNICIVCERICSYAYNRSL